MKLPEYSRVYSLLNYHNTEEFILYETTKIQRSLFFMKLPEYREVFIFLSMLEDRVVYTTLFMRIIMYVFKHRNMNILKPWKYVSY